MAEQVRCGVTYDTPADLQAAVGPRLVDGELFVPYPDDVPEGTEAAIDLMLDAGAKVELIGIVKGSDFDDRGNIGLAVTLSEESSTLLKQFIATVTMPAESSPSGLYATTRFTRPKTNRISQSGQVSSITEEPEQLLEPGTLLEERFRIEAHIASGGMGEVYRAAHVHLKRPVALKLLKRALTSDQDMWARFQREAELVSQLENPHIVRVFDFGKTQSGQPFLAMEYVEGTPLDHAVAKGPLEPARAVDILSQVCEGLAEAHALGIVHRDLKPSNIVLGKKRGGAELAKILDFGIAKTNDKSANEGRLTQTGMVIGTPMYLAPEQALAGELDERTDVYALGCVAYELLTGKPPFIAPELAQVISMHLTQAPTDPTRARPELVPFRPVVIAVLRALAKKKADRFANVTAFAEALRAGLAESLPPPTSGASNDAVWPPPSASAPGQRPNPVLAPAPPPLAPSGSADDFFSSQAGPGAHPLSVAPLAASPRQVKLEALGLPLAKSVLEELLKAREGFGLTGNRLLVAHLEVTGAPAKSSRAKRCLTRALMVARAWSGAVDLVEDDRLVLLFGGEALATTARAVTALVAIREAVHDEATRGPDPGPASIRAAIIQASTKTDLGREIDERVTRKAQVLAAKVGAGVVVLEKQLGAECADVVEAKAIEQGDALEIVGRRARLSSNPPPLVGRDGVMQLLEKRLASLGVGVVAPFLVRAPRGSGRSAMVAELANRARTKGFVVGIARSPLSLREVPYGAVTDLLCSVVGVSPETRASTLRAALEKLNLPEATLTAALVITGVVQLATAFTAGQAAQALRAVLRAGASGRPVLLLFDGIEGFDDPSAETFRELVTHAIPKELTIGFVDPEVPLDRLGSVPSVDVTALTRADVAQWLSAVLAVPPAPGLVEKIFTVSGGVPGRMLDLTYWLHDRALLRQQAGQTTLVGDVPAAEGDALLRARLSALPLEVVRLLEAAALVGDTFDGAQVAIALPRVTPQALQQAVQTRLLKSAGGRRWMFNSSRLQRLVLDTPSPERQAMHQRVATVMVDQARSAPASIDSVRLAGHLNAAGDGVRAAALWRHAAETSLAKRALRDAIAAARGWVEALGQTKPMTPEVTRARVDALARAAGISLSLQDAALARTLVDEAVALQGAQDLGSPELALSIARVHRSEARRARASEALALAERRAGETPFRALVDAERAEACEQDGDLPGAALAWEAALTRCQAAEELGRWHGEINLTARVEARLAGAKLMRKETAGARTLLNSSLTRWRQTNWPAAEARVLANLGTLCVQTNQLPEAARHFEAAAVAGAASGDLLFQAKMLLQQAKVAKRQGQLPQSKQLAQQVRVLCVDIGWEEGRVQAESL